MYIVINVSYTNFNVVSEAYKIAQFAAKEVSSKITLALGQGQEGQTG